MKKIFTRINQIRPVEVYVVILVVAAVVFATRFFSTESNYRTIRIEVTSNPWEVISDQYRHKAPFWLSNKLTVGQTERSASGRVVAEVIDLENYQRSDGQVQIYAVVKVLADYNQKNLTYSFRGQDLLVGSPVEFRFGGVLVPGQIIDENYPPNGYRQGKFIVEVRYRGAEPWFVEQLEVGNKAIDRSSGEKIAELVGFRTDTSSLAYVEQASGELIFSLDPKQRDVLATLEILAQNIDDKWFYAGEQVVRVGSGLWIYLDDVTFYGATIENLEYVAE